VCGRRAEVRLRFIATKSDWMPSADYFQLPFGLAAAAPPRAVVPAPDICWDFQ
jgi:hypothetical protein